MVAIVLLLSYENSRGFERRLFSRVVNIDRNMIEIVLNVITNIEIKTWVAFIVRINISSKITKECCIHKTWTKGFRFLPINCS